MVSTADVVAYRDAINPKEKQTFDFQWLSSMENKGITLEKSMTNVQQSFREFSSRSEGLEAK